MNNYLMTDLSIRIEYFMGIYYETRDIDIEKFSFFSNLNLLGGKGFRYWLIITGNLQDRT